MCLLCIYLACDFFVCTFSALHGILTSFPIVKSSWLFHHIPTIFQLLHSTAWNPSHSYSWRNFSWIPPSFCSNLGYFPGLLYSWTSWDFSLDYQVSSTISWILYFSLFWFSSWSNYFRKGTMEVNFMSPCTSENEFILQWQNSRFELFSLRTLKATAPLSSGSHCCW